MDYKKKDKSKEKKSENEFKNISFSLFNLHNYNSFNLFQNILDRLIDEIIIEGPIIQVFNIDNTNIYIFSN